MRWTAGRAAVSRASVETAGRVGSCPEGVSAASVRPEDTSVPTAPSRPGPSLQSPSSCFEAYVRDSTSPSRSRKCLFIPDPRWRLALILRLLSALIYLFYQRLRHRSNFPCLYSSALSSVALTSHNPPTQSCKCTPDKSCRLPKKSKKLALNDSAQLQNRLRYKLPCGLNTSELTVSGLVVKCKG